MSRDHNPPTADSENPASGWDYYNRNADKFIADTESVDMHTLYGPFLRSLKASAHILDAGCGSGRDALAFKRMGFHVTAFDASEKLALHASRLLNQTVATMTFSELEDTERYHAIWACASLLHVPQLQQQDVFARLWAALKPGGVLYCSYKQGTGERIHNGRRFSDAEQRDVEAWTATLPGLTHKEYWYTSDQRPGRDQQWLNVLLYKSAKKLVTGGSDNPFLPHLCAAIHRSDEIDIAVAFVKTTGLRLLLPDLFESLQRDGNDVKPAQLRFLTSDYLDVTDPEALRLLMLLREQGADVRVFQTSSQGFHLKAYLFRGETTDGVGWGTGFIGSSNISRQALKHGLEWNYQISYPGDTGFLEARQRFEELFSSDHCILLSDEWISAYEQRRTLSSQIPEAGSNEFEPPPDPTDIQQEALRALRESRHKGYSRGLVVLATGLGKTYLAAFDTWEIGAKRVLFVAHREEILDQAAATFSRTHPRASIGYYRGQQRDSQVDILCASIQTLGKLQHLDRFDPGHFDYIVVDEFHHAAAPTYHRLLNYFRPRFLLGLTATPDRTDNASILALCDGNLVHETSLFEGITQGQLVPFHYFGIFDQDVDYQSIPWRSGRFDPDTLGNKLATLSRAKHALTTWRDSAQSRTLAFCVSRSHADFMAHYFRKQGVKAEAVYANSHLSRGEALEKLSQGQLQVLFSVDLFNEGVDLPAIDTVMMLRPTESKILFLQQLGRGLRCAETKDRLVVLDFVANHQSFLHKPMALMNRSMTHRQLADFARAAQTGQLALPEGCYINYDLEFIDFLKSLEDGTLQGEYRNLRDVLGRRPSLTEFYRSGASLSDLRRAYHHWFALVAEQENDLPESILRLIEQHSGFWRELMTTSMTKSYKMVTLEAFQELDGWATAPDLETLSLRSWSVLQRRRELLSDLPEDYQGLQEPPGNWLAYWKRNPIDAWQNSKYFFVEDNLFIGKLAVAAEDVPLFGEMVQEILDYRLANYRARTGQGDGKIVPLKAVYSRQELPYFPDLKIACGHFKTGRTDVEEYRHLSEAYGRLDTSRHFIARASGNSMNGGKNPIFDGDHLLLELISPDRAGKITGDVLAIERQDGGGDNQYLLRQILKDPNGQYRLRAKNPTYQDVLITDDLRDQFRTFARLKAVIPPLEMALGQPFMREDIPGLFGASFNPGNWHSGHVVIPEAKAHVLLVTLNKQGKAADLRYHDHWIDSRHFHWQTQNQTSPQGSRGRELIHHEELGIAIHLFVREHKLAGGKAAPFVYHGRVRYQHHEGSKPMSVVFALMD